MRWLAVAAIGILAGCGGKQCPPYLAGPLNGTYAVTAEDAGGCWGWGGGDAGQALYLGFDQNSVFDVCYESIGGNGCPCQTTQSRCGTWSISCSYQSIDPTIDSQLHGVHFATVQVSGTLQQAADDGGSTFTGPMTWTCFWDAGTAMTSVALDLQGHP